MGTRTIITNRLILSPSVSGTLIGSITVTHYDKSASIMEIGYVIGKSWWFYGFTTEALSAIVKYLFENIYPL